LPCSWQSSKSTSNKSFDAGRQARRSDQTDLRIRGGWIETLDSGDDRMHFALGKDVSCSFNVGVVHGEEGIISRRRSLLYWVSMALRDLKSARTLRPMTRTVCLVDSLRTSTIVRPRLPVPPATATTTMVTWQDLILKRPGLLQ
jgi:hypothetical protein